MSYFGNTITDPTTGHADDKLGFAVAAGVKWNAPFIGQGDYFQGMVSYSQGALRYLFQTTQPNWGFVNGQSMSFGVVADGVVGGTLGLAPAGIVTDIELTTAWVVNAAYEHFWSPRWRTSVYGGYAQITYGETANNMLCWAIGGGNGSIVNGVPVSNAGCDMNWTTWWAGTRTQWNVTKDFYMGLDVMYSKLEGGSTLNGVTTGGITPAGLGAGTPTLVDSNQDNWSFRFRVHRDFYP